MVYSCEILEELRRWRPLEKTFTAGKGIDVRKAERGRDERGTPESGVDHVRDLAEPETAPSGTGGADGGFRLSDMDALEREITVLYRRARASSGEMARQVHPDLEPAAYGLLVRLEEAGEERATELAAYFGVGKATMSRQLRALEELGLVSRDPDPADGRAFLVRLTAEGRSRFTRVRDARRAGYRSRLASWDHADVRELARLLGRLNAEEAV